MIRRKVGAEGGRGSQHILLLGETMGKKISYKRKSSSTKEGR
jgi:hypothetical protein